MSNHQSYAVYTVPYDSDDLFVNCIRIDKKYYHTSARKRRYHLLTSSRLFELFNIEKLFGAWTLVVIPQTWSVRPS